MKRQYLKQKKAFAPSVLARGIAAALVTISLSSQAQEVTSVASTDWNSGSTWSNRQPPSSAFDYRISTGNTVFSTPVTTSGEYVRDFLGRSLTVSAGGALDLRSTSSANNALVNYRIPNLRLEDGSTLILGAASGNVNRTLDTSLGLADSGKVLVDVRQSAFNNNLTLAATSVLSGGADLQVNISQGGSNAGERGYLRVLSVNNPYSGNWIVNSVNVTSLDRRGLLYANARNALGTGSVSLQHSILVNGAVGGLSSLSAVNVGTRSTLDARASFSNDNLLVWLQANDSTFEIKNAGTRAEVGQLRGVTSSRVIGNTAGQVLASRSAQNWQFDGVISGPLALIKGGTGTWTLTNNQTYNGGTTIEAGTLQLGGGGTTGSIVGNVLNDGTLAFNRSNAYLFAGAISGSGSVAQIGTGTTTLTADSTYTGGTTISAGTLQLGNGGTTGSIVGNVLNNSALLFNRSNAYLFGGTISGSGSLAQIGTGTTTLTGMNSYAGTTDVMAGRLNINGDQSGATGTVTVHNNATLGGIGTIGGTVMLADGAHLSPGQSPGTLTVLGDLQAAPGAIFDYEFGQASVVGGSANDLLNVGGDLLLDGTINVSVTPGGSFDTGVYRVMNYGGQLTDQGLDIGTAPNPDLFVQTSVPGQVNLINSNGLTLDFWDGQDPAHRNNQFIDGGVGTWTASGNDNWTDSNGVLNAPYTPASFAVFGGTAATVTVDNSQGAITSSGMQFLVDGYTLSGGVLSLVAPITTVRVGDGTQAGGAFTATVGSQLVGDSQVEKADAGTLILTGANTYTGGTTISAGTLQLGNGGTTGSIIGNVVDNGALVFNRSNGYLFTGTISGTGTVEQAGSGTTTLTADNTYTGVTTISAGTLQLGNGGTTGSIVGDVLNNSALVFNRSNAYLFDGAVSGSGSVAQIGTGTTTLTADSTYTGGTTISAGTLQLGNGGTTGSIVGNVLNNSALLFSRSNAYLFDGTISGSGSLAQIGTGTTTLTGMNSYAGTTDVMAGRLNINGDQSGATGTVTVHNNATLGGIGTIGGSVMLADGAHLSPGQSVGTLTVLGDLQAAPSAIFDYEFGQASVVGGSDNDLLNVGGDLLLDGVINVSVTPGGSFDTGVYRVVNYGGQLTDQGLDIGTAPYPDLFVQTSVPGQVNLINSNGLTLNFWDGQDPTHRNNQLIDGGVGTWTASGNDNWTDSSGALNAPYTPASFAVFGGTAATVTVDNSQGAITSSGMQFLVDGYTLNGGDLSLVAPITIVRVGDGTQAGSAFTAAVASRLVGDSLLAKVDAGTLILTGANTYTGGTAVRGGVLQITDDSQLGAAAGAVTLNGGTLRTMASTTSQRAFTAGPNGGSLDTASGTTHVLAAGIGGTGDLFKLGEGTLRLDADGAYAGVFNITAGRVLAGAMDVLGEQAAYRIDPLATLDLAAYSQRILSMENNGTIQWGMPDTTLTIGGDYLSNNGRLAMVAVLGFDDSPTSLMHVMGSTSGTTQVSVENRGGLGAVTSSGIKIIDVDGASNGVFSLLGDYKFGSEEIVVGGAFGYRLQKNSGTGVEDGDWYLVSRLLQPLIPDPGPLPVDPPGPIFQAGVPIYEVYADTLLDLAQVDSLWQRTGSAADSFASELPSEDRFRPWIRTAGNRVDHVPERSTSHSAYETHSWQLQAGLDALLAANDNGAWVGGLSVRTLDGSPRVSSPYGDGRIETRGYGLKATVTWYSNAGFYLDTQLQYDWMKSDLRSTLANVDLTRDNRGGVLGAGIEIGARFPLNPGWSLVPQLQLSYAHANFDRFVDVYDAEVDLTEAESLTTRLGTALEYRSEADTRGRRFAGHLIGDLIYDTADASRVAISGTELLHDNAPFGTRLGAGGSFQWGGGLYSLDLEVSRIDMLNNDSDGWTANINLRGSW